MSWVAVDREGEYIYHNKPIKVLSKFWYDTFFQDEGMKLPKGSIKKLIDRELTWDDEPVELK